MFVFSFGREGGYLIDFETKNQFINVDDIKKALKGTYLEIGTHFIWVKMKASTIKNDALVAASDQCYFYVRPENATATLGRMNKNVRKGTVIIVDASKSKNNDIDKKTVGLFFRWNCTDNMNFCKGRNLGTDSKVKIEKKFAKEGARFTFTVEVRTEQTLWQKATQLILVNSDRPYAVNCIKNCGKEPNTWNPRLKPWIYSECQFFCNKYRRQKIKGKLFDDKGKLLASYPNIASSPVGIGTVKKPGKKFKIKVYHEENKKVTLVGETEFYTYPIPKLSNCKSIPPRGSPMTKFKISCSYDKKKTSMFKLQIKTNNTVVYSTNAPTVEEIEFFVSSESEVSIIIEDINGVTKTQTVSIAVDPITVSNNVTNATGSLLDIYKGTDEMNSVTFLIKEGDYETALQIIGIIASAIGDLNVTNDAEKEMVKTLKMELLKDLQDIKINNIDLAKSVSGIVNVLSRTNPGDSDPEMAKLLAAICSELSISHLYLMENDSDKKISDQDAEIITKNLLSCAESETLPSHGIFNQSELDFENTTKYPIRPELSVQTFEDYPQYVSDDIIQDKVQDFIHAAESVLEICRGSSYSMMIPLSPEMTSPIYVRGRQSIIALMKSTGFALSNAKFEQHGVTIVPSISFRKMLSIVAMRVCSYSYNPFWSASLDFQIPTSVLDVNIMKMPEKKELTNFGTSPMNISFGLLKNSKVEKKITNCTIFDPDWTSKFKEDDFTIFLVEVKKKESFFIEFYNLTNDHDIELVVADMERPTLAHFANAEHIDVKKNKLFIEVNGEDHDKWYLLGMKPGRAMRTDSIDVWFSVYTPRCIQWDSRKKTWKFACSVYVTTTHHKIHCRCLHLSTLAGSIDYNNLKEHPKLLRIEFYLEATGSLYIILLVIFFYFMYFFLLMYSAKMNETLEDAVFFLADVPAHCRYAYLVVVKTGDKISSGTTSDIIIEVVGQNGSSLSHVLNFPDPFLELLRRSSEDYFVFASKFHLGSLLRIHLWFDCSGNSPDWYCNSVKICDLQTKKWYKFKVKKWLRIDGTPRLFMSIPLAEKDAVGSSSLMTHFLKGFLKFGNLNHTMWQLMKTSNEPNFSTTKRLTLMLSVILSVMSISLKFHASPEFLPRDSITKQCFYGFGINDVFIGLYSAAIAFFPHLGVMTGFKKSKLQYQKRTQKNLFMLPTAFTYIFWVAVTLNILIHTHVLLILGYWVISPVIWAWTISCLIAMFFYIFFMDFFFNLLLDMLMRKKESRTLDFGRILKNVEVQRKNLYKLFGRYIYRPILDPVYNFLTGAKYMAKARRIYFRQKREVTWQIQDLFMTITLMIFFYLIILGERDDVYDITGHEEVLRLINGTRDRHVQLKEVTHPTDLAEYMEKTFIPATQSNQWYGRYVFNNPGMTSDNCNKYLGVVRLRQHRVETESCIVAEPMQFLNVTCYSSLYFFQYDSQNYTPQWNITIPKYHQSRLGFVWGYQPKTGSSRLSRIAYYPSGGYIAYLGRTLKNSLMNLSYLKRMNWIDRRTRAVVIEFAIYNVNSNLFHFVEILIERTVTGYMDTNLRVTTERILKYGGKGNTISLACAILFIIFVIIISFRVVMRIILTRTWEKRDLWHVLDVGIVVLSIAWVSMHFKKLSVLQKFTKQLEENRRNAFIDFFEMLNIINTLSFLTSFLVCLTILRIWKLLRFAIVFRIVERTLVLSFETLVFMSFGLIISLIAFGYMGYVFLGSKTKEFKDWYVVLRTLLGLLSTVEKTSPSNLGQNERGLGYTFFVLYGIFCVIIRIMFCAIIVYNYKKAQQFAFDERIEYNMKDYVIDKSRHLKRLAAMWMDKFRLKAGGEGEHYLVNPKEICVRYMNFVETDSNRMKAMASVAKSVLTKKMKGLRVDEEDHAMMMRTVKNLQDRSPGKREIFFIQGNKLAGFRFVDDRKMLKMERIVKSLLESPQERATRRKTTDLNEALRADNLARMMQMNYRLKLMLKTVKNIEVQIIGLET
ncbi:uncharacterized protein LOC123313714 [Coccinella septempunctata]|uniref:uncharacterized protein LOC123313714 n=1 Tax=Coccinella septempunctata TaxID=41139 RepID=UPI001D08C489|nr:uncharacterized protein LOC123313714 [Coccinella septempunctata]